MNLDNFIQRNNNSPFQKSYKTRFLRLRGLDEKDLYSEYAFKYQKYIPEFQRDNKKWTKKMQVSFVENLILGCPTSILLYTTSKREFPEWQILDGLQRLTAFNLFVNNKLKVFGEYFFKDISHELNDIPKLELKMYRFDTEKEAVEFYISMNENITHSKADIKKARDWLVV
ncbi:MAG: DUF262 domain-containing protein [Campylobacterota bacterium]|nr:DUF262 domain-containing protein [Campylobacterota bacterium]